MNIKALKLKILKADRIIKSIEAGHGGKTATECLLEITKKIMTGNKALSYSGASEQAQKENLELAEMYRKEVQQPSSRLA